MLGDRRESAQPTALARPVGITLIAWFQFAKSAVMLLTVVLLKTRPDLVKGQESPLYPLLYVATRGRYDALSALGSNGNALIELFLFLGCYLGAIGLGLLTLNAWARRTLILNGAVTLVLSLITASHPALDPSRPPDMTNFYVLLAVDFCIFLYLMRMKTAELFERKRKAAANDAPTGRPFPQRPAIAAEE